MKRVILLLMAVFFTMVSAKTLTDPEKQEMLKQFSVFQKALESKDGNTLKGMIKFPILLVEHGRDYDESIKEKDFLDELDDVAEGLKGIAYMKVNTENNSVSDYLEEGFRCDLKYTGSFKENELHIIAELVTIEGAPCDYYKIYKFKMYKNKLKLFDAEIKE